MIACYLFILWHFIVYECFLLYQPHTKIVFYSGLIISYLSEDYYFSANSIIRCTLLLSRKSSLVLYKWSTTVKNNVLATTRTYVRLRGNSQSGMKFKNQMCSTRKAFTERKIGFSELVISALFSCNFSAVICLTQTTLLPVLTNQLNHLALNRFALFYCTLSWIRPSQTLQLS